MAEGKTNNTNNRTAEEIILDNPDLVEKRLKAEEILENGRGPIHDRKVDDLQKEILNTQFPKKRRNILQRISDSIRLKN